VAVFYVHVAQVQHNMESDTLEKSLIYCRYSSHLLCYYSLWQLQHFDKHKQNQTH